MSKQNNNQSPTIENIQSPSVIKGGYQEVSPSPPPDPDPPDTWGTAIPSNTTPVNNQPTDEASKPPKDK